jgi:glycosyltransferase involved in cell wall biosynthesis
MSVSIVTITQKDRFDCLKILKELIEEQTYKNILEWIIVEGSQNIEDAEINKTNIKSLETSINIKYIPYDGNTILGQLRNKSNDESSGDYIVCMDDDDYYPKERIDHAVKTLKLSSNLIAGNNGCMLYDYILDKQFKSEIDCNNHSTNNCMAYKKAYLKNHRYDNTKKIAEETSFTNSFTEPMCQLDPKKTIIISSHDVNTCNKRLLLINSILTDGKYKETPPSIPKKYYKLYKAFFRKEETSKYDIVYMCGGFSINWDPRDLKLGGSEQAVVHLSSEWSKQGYKVAVYGVVPLVTHLNVDYYPYEMFPFHHEFNILILWRMFGLFTIHKFNLNAKRIFWDLHDNMLNVTGSKELYLSYESKINYIMFKSNYHRDEFEKMLGRKLDDKISIIIMNGIRIDKFQDVELIQRNKYRFCYCSCYTRGLENILKNVWPLIYRIEPRAELHIYYGLNSNNENWKNMMQMLLSSPGVMDHGRQDVSMINREKHMSTFHLYLSSSQSEIDCISVRESLVAGCIPILTNFGIFKDRDGFHLDSDKGNIGLSIINLLKIDDVDLENERLKLKQSKTIISWEDVANLWISEFL